MSNGRSDKLQKLGLSDQETFNGAFPAQRTDIHSQLMGTSGTHSYVGQFQTFLKDFTIDRRD